MNLAKSKLVLKKINTLYDTLELSEELSKIEKDLLLDYIKELYEMVINLDHKKDKRSKSLINSEKSSRKKEKKRIEQLEKEEVAEEPLEVAISMESAEEQIEDVMSVRDPSPEPKSNGVHIHAHPVVKAAPAAVEVQVSSEIQSLFDSSILDQVDYRFSQTPITDITKAMGINERMLIVNLLFNKDQQDFNYITSKLNYFNSFDEAIQYLKTEVAGKYEWGNVEKREKAIEFIKLIKRKYA